jgi:hypothetical protein
VLWDGIETLYLFLSRLEVIYAECYVWHSWLYCRFAQHQEKCSWRRMCEQIKHRGPDDGGIGAMSWHRRDRRGSFFASSEKVVFFDEIR